MTGLGTWLSLWESWHGVAVTERAGGQRPPLRRGTMALVGAAISRPPVMHRVSRADDIRPYAMTIYILKYSNLIQPNVLENALSYPCLSPHTLLDTEGHAG